MHSSSFEDQQISKFYEVVKQVSEMFGVEIHVHNPTTVHDEIFIKVHCEEETALKLLERKLAQWQFENANCLTHKFLRVSK